MPLDIEKLVGQIAKYSSDGIFVADLMPDASSLPKIMWCNNSACELSGFAQEELLDQPLYVLIGGSQDAKIYIEIVERMHQHAPIEKRFANITKAGKNFQMSLSLQPVEDETNPTRYWIGFQRDITTDEIMRNELRISQKELTLYKQRLWDAIDALPDAFVMYDVNDQLVVCNSKYKEFYAASAPAIYPGALFKDIMRYGVENGQYPEAKGREEEWLEEWYQWHLARRKGGTEPIERELPGDRHILIHDIETENGDLVGLRTDVTELTHKKRQLEKLTRSLEKAKDQAEVASRTDPLTGVGNRRGLEIYLDEVAKRRKPNHEVAFVHFDLDHFKAVNDEYGHAAGDAVLCRIAETLQQCTRSADFIARIGGDEFVVVLLAEKAQKVAETVAQRVTEACKRAVRYEGHALRFGTSIGIAVANDDELLQLQKRADEALYDAKAQGRGKYVLYG